MKKILILLLFTSCIAVTEAQKKSAQISKSPRIEKIINSQWTFNYLPDASADIGYESAGFDDSRWPAVSIPHTWSTYETTGEIHPYIKSAAESDNPYWWNGWGWYRKHFTIKPDYSGRKVFIEFEGVQKYCKVWINGKFLGDHKGGYGSFDFDITDFIIPGNDNVLAVAVNNAQNDKFKIPPMVAGDLNVYGGIYREVTLVLKDKLYIPMQGSAIHEGGTFVTTPRVSEKEGVVRVQTWVKNDYPQPKACVLNTYIYDAAGKMVQVMKSKYTIGSKQSFKFDQTSKPVKKPRLWSTENPCLYRVYTELVDGNRVADSFSSPLGFRWFRWDYRENTLYVNGKKVIINAVNRQQEYPWLGDAIPKWITAMDFKEIAENQKHNLIRTSHYPNDRQVYDLTDKYGLIVIEESPSIRNQAFSAEVQEQQMKEMIRRDRNHPSIFFWSISNETNHPVDSKFAAAEDTTRILTARKVTERSAGAYIRHSYENLAIENLHRSTITGSAEKTAAAQPVKAGEPAKIILQGSHQKTGADRASVVIITADIVDSRGNHVDGANNTVKWSVTGPASLVGPAVFEAGIAKPEQMNSLWYTTMPVSNIIRSTGKPGKISFAVSASGLASGSFDIGAEELISDNSVITEPVLEDVSRRPVARLLFGVDRLDEVPREIAPTYSDFNFGTADKQSYAGKVREYIMKNNPTVDSTTVEFKELVSLFSIHLSNNNGRLVAYDYNFSVDHYNNCRLISGYINATKLPPLFKEGLKKYYADAIIRQGSEKNAGDEMNWMNWIPSGGTVVISQEGGTAGWPRGTVVTNKTQLADLIAAVYPVFIKYNEEAKERALTFVSKMNPYIRVTSTSEQSTAGGTEKVAKINYTAEKGKPILIPEIKFISQ